MQGINKLLGLTNFKHERQPGRLRLLNQVSASRLKLWDSFTSSFTSQALSERYQARLLIHCPVRSTPAIVAVEYMARLAYSLEDCSLMRVIDELQSNVS